MMTDNKIITVGRLGMPYGIKGWLKVHAYTDPISNLLQFKDYLIHHNQSWRPITVSDSKLLNQHIIFKIDGIDDRDLASTYTNSDIAITRQQLPALAEDEYYWSDLIGLTVMTTSGIKLGIIQKLIATGSNDVFIVKNEKREHWLPYTSQVVISIHLETKTMIVDWDPEF